MCPTSEKCPGLRVRGAGRTLLFSAPEAVSSRVCNSRTPDLEQECRAFRQSATNSAAEAFRRL